MIWLAALALQVAVVIAVGMWAERDHRSAQRAAEDERAGRRGRRL